MREKDDLVFLILLFSFLRKLYLILLFMYPLGLQSQVFTFDQVSIEEGLSNNTVYSIIEDQEGFIWFGTRDGLNRYDGSDCEVFKDFFTDSLSTSSNAVQCVFQDSKGEMWLGFRRGGLARKPQGRAVFERESLGSIDFNTLTVESIFEDSQGGLWVGTLGGGIFYRKRASSTFERFYSGATRKSAQLANDLVFSFVEDHKKDIWIGTEGHYLHCYQRDKNSIIQVLDRPEEGFDIGSYSKSLIFYEKKLWLGTEGSGLYIYDPLSGDFQKKNLGNNLVKDISLDKEGRIWVSTDGSGLFFSSDKGGEFTQLKFSETLKNGLNTNALYDIYVDQQGNIWVGSFNGGVNVYKQNKPKFLTFLQSVNRTQASGYQSVLSFYEDEEDRVWVGTDGGGLLNFNLQNYNYSVFENDPGDTTSISSNVITSLYKDDEGILWIGTFSRGLNRFDTKTGNFYHYEHDVSNPNSLSQNNVWDLTEDQQNNLWIANLGGGLDKFDYQNNRFRHFVSMPNDPQSISDIQTRVLLLTRDNILWVGTEYGGLNQKVKDGFVNWGNKLKKQGFPSNAILCLKEDAQGNILIGTEGGGLLIFNPERKTLKKYTQDQGLASNVINAIEIDFQGNLWLSTNQGVSFLDLKKQHFINFNKKDGLQSNQFNPNASYQDAQGRIYFGGINGFNVFDPEKVYPNLNPPKVAFTSFKLLNEEIGPGERFKKGLNQNPTISLSYFENLFSITFTALEFTNPSKNQVSYRLLDFEKEWNNIPKSKYTASFTNLDPGTYTFQVRARKDNGVWSKETAQITIIITPPFWGTLWFKILSILLGVGIFISIIRYQNAQKEQEYQRKLLLKQQEVLQKDNRLLTEEIDRKNAELSATLLQTAHKNNTFISIKKRLEELHELWSPPEKVNRELNRLFRQIDEEISSDDYWEQFQINFDTIHQDFSRKIESKHPKLTANDIRLCCLIRINLSNPEIASIQNISSSGVEKSRYRLKKKLNLSKEEDLNHYLQQFS